MRIWYNSTSSIGKNPKFALYEKALIKNVTRLGRPGTEITIHGVEKMTPQLDTYKYFRYLNTLQLFENGLQAEKEGYDAFIVGCFGDPGYYELKGLLNIPVVFLGESSLITAMMLGEKFGFVGHWQASMANMLRNVDQYGWRSRLAGTSCINISLEDVQTWFTNTAAIGETFRKEAEVLVKQGAEVIIPPCGVLNQVIIEAGIKNIDGAIVLDAAAAAIKVAEMQVDLAQINGQPVARRMAFPMPSREMLAAMRSMYGEKPLP